MKYRIDAYATEYSLEKEVAKISREYGMDVEITHVTTTHEEGINVQYKRVKSPHTITINGQVYELIDQEPLKQPVIPDYFLERGYNHRIDGDRAIRDIDNTIYHIQFSSLEVLEDFITKYPQSMVCIRDEKTGDLLETIFIVQSPDRSTAMFA